MTTISSIYLFSFIFGDVHAVLADVAYLWRIQGLSDSWYLLLMLCTTMWVTYKSRKEGYRKYSSTLSSREKRRERLEKRNIDDRRNSSSSNQDHKRNMENLHMVAHDLRGPLNHIEGLTQLLKYEIGPEKDATSLYLQKITDSITRMNEMINNILEIKNLSESNLEVNRQKLDCREILEDHIVNYQVSASEKNIPIHTDFPSEELWIEVDGGLFLQVLDNLLSNAIKFSPLGGKVEIKGHLVDKYVVIEVKDEGPGIGGDDQRRLFQKFEQLSARPTAGEVSTGLGLYIVKKYTEAMGGSVTCRSQKGRGSIFSLAFPALR